MLILENNDILNLESEVNLKHEIIDNWIKFNCLSLNCSKSSYFIVTRHHKNSASAFNNFIIKIGALKIPSSILIKYVGIIRWQDYLNDIRKNFLTPPGFRLS